MMRREEGERIRRVLELELGGKGGRGRPRLGWREQVEKDMSRAGLRREDVWDRSVWREKGKGFSS